eukprot:c10272_g1_i2 orf=99-269(-)
MPQSSQQITTTIQDLKNPVSTAQKSGDPQGKNIMSSKRLNNLSNNIDMFSHGSAGC